MAAEVCGLPAASVGPQDPVLRDFARDRHIKYVEAFVAVVDTIESTGRLPDCYLSKPAAEARRWREGADLWQVAPGAAIGGDRYSNRDGRLPAAYNGRYREADLDYAGGHRGGHRLVFVEGSAGRWLQWVTVDHYRHFFKLPATE